MFTLENVFEKRKKFEQACKRANACNDEFHKLLKAETKAEFMEVIYSNFIWVYKEVTRFGLKYDYTYHFNEGFACVRIGDKYGYINRNGKEICDVKYDYVYNFDEGFACVRIGDKWGFINSKGKEICDVKYDYAFSFNEGFARVQLGNKWGFIDTKFKEISEIKYDAVDNFHEGIAGVEIGNKWGILDGDGKEVYEVKYTLDEVIKLLKGLKKCSH